MKPSRISWLQKYDVQRRLRACILARKPLL